MHNPYAVPIWKKSPFIRLLLPLMAGILLQWHWQFPLAAILISALGFTIVYGLFFCFSIGIQFRLQSLQGVVVNLMIVALGLVITWQTDGRNNGEWYGKFYEAGDLIIVRIDEPLVEKAKSYKANGFVEAIIHHDSVINCNGKILMYFSKSIKGVHPGTVLPLQYGDKILLGKTLQRIKNSGNPGAFNYERYAGFQNIFHNVFIKDHDWIKLPGKNINWLKQLIYSARDHILFTLRENINSGKDELGIAQALLIGYTNDLDKDLVQAYSNTGVVHIIAISGMHLALIYLLLAGLFKKVPGINKSRLLQVLLILGCLWFFSLLTGASASVTRAAVMFSFITIGKHFNRQSSIFNSLAASAFVLLCYNPYFLWDVGFQLSYLAVISIIIFQRPVHNCWYIKNKWIEKIWELSAVSLSAQILTFPVCIYYFHQFPNFFLLTNIIAVPLSGIILYTEIGLIAFSWNRYAGFVIGKSITWMVWLMNKTIIWVNGFPFAVWEGIPSTVLTTWLLYAVVICAGACLINKSIALLRLALAALLLFVLVSIYNDWKIKHQKKLIIYNVARLQAIDFINGNEFVFRGDSILLQDGMLQNFNIKPTRIALQLNRKTESVSNLYQHNNCYQFNNKRILIIDRPLSFKAGYQKTGVDIIVISKNTPVLIAILAQVFDCPLYVFDASNSLWKIVKWQKECEELHLRSYSIPERGAFVTDIR
ncbi:MAG: ComEC/Rec2 family competence protein [Ferruginibacter sp.]|nr:ComEC/Rec2 family competence protein [Ferruginibacter sp.]